MTRGRGTTTDSSCGRARQRVRQLFGSHYPPQQLGADGEPPEVRQVGRRGIGDQHVQPRVVRVDQSTELSSGPPTQIRGVEVDR